jgi:hypothetical protein
VVAGRENDALCFGDEVDEAVVSGIESGLKHESDNIYRVDVVPIGGPQPSP